MTVRLTVGVDDDAADRVAGARRRWGSSVDDSRPAIRAPGARRALSADEPEPDVRDADALREIPRRNRRARSGRRSGGRSRRGRTSIPETTYCAQLSMSRDGTRVSSPAQRPTMLSTPSAPMTTRARDRRRRRAGRASRRAPAVAVAAHRRRPRCRCASRRPRARPRRRAPARSACGRGCNPRRPRRRGPRCRRAPRR